ncbi:MAG TPA: hypothetical protein VMB81_18550, partial [Candidatus Sulfotelmatobacter sp.]|nr:hypothetical protein [Candidatus Sulfotelmatobacter sp.]
NHGLFGEQNFPVMKTDTRQFIVGIFGGSVAAAFALEERGGIAQVVRGVPGYEDRDVLVLDLAMGGFHQPVQLFVLNYMLTLGQTFDLIINLDGFNEAFCGWDNAENFKTHVSMPNAWFIFGQQNEFVSKRSYGNTRAILAARARLRRIENEMLGARSALHFYALRLIWELIQRRATQIESDYSKPHPDRDYPVYLLPQERVGLRDVAQEIANIWARSIFQTKAIADLIGAPFIEMLQPSQYYGPRVFSEEERRVAFVDPPFYGAGIVPDAYDAMRGYAGEFASRGIRFVDTTAAFDNYTGHFYHDAVCHINRRGMDVILNELLAHQIRDALQTSRGSRG